MIFCLSFFQNQRLVVTIISRLCINYLESARVPREEYVGQWLPQPLVTDPKSDPLGIIRVDKSISMAFLIVLERLRSWTSHRRSAATFDVDPWLSARPCS